MIMKLQIHIKVRRYNGVIEQGKSLISPKIRNRN